MQLVVMNLMMTWLEVSLSNNMKYYIPFFFVKWAVDLTMKLFQKRANTWLLLLREKTNSKYGVVTCLPVTNVYAHRAMNAEPKSWKKGEKLSCELMLPWKWCQKKKRLENCIYNIHQPIDHSPWISLLKVRYPTGFRQKLTSSSRHKLGCKKRWYGGWCLKTKIVMTCCVINQQFHMMYLRFFGM